MKCLPAFRIAAFAVASAGLLGCHPQEKDGDYVARVGAARLSTEDVVSALSSVPPGLDSTHAARQIIDRWITDELLSQEAIRRNLQSDPEVRRRLEESERSVLIGSLVDRLYEEVEPPTEREIAAYFERNVDNLQLREPFLRVRYLSTSDSSGAAQAVQALDSIAVTTDPDSVWLQLIYEVGGDPETETVLSSNYFPASRLFRNVPYLQEVVRSLEPGQSRLLMTDDGDYHVIQVVDRIAAGTTPRLEWITEDVRNRLLIDKRKQMYIDQVQRLRNRALAEGVLEVRE